MKTRHCYECKFLIATLNGKAVCEKGHKPKFFVAKTAWQKATCDYGYKRKCLDFEGKK